jgi:hypothetical protein
MQKIHKFDKNFSQETRELLVQNHDGIYNAKKCDTSTNVLPHCLFCNSFCSEYFLHSPQVVWVRITRAEMKFRIR